MDGIELVGKRKKRPGRALVAATAPDVLLRREARRSLSGLEVKPLARRALSSVEVIMLTMSEDHDTALTALRVASDTREGRRPSVWSARCAGRSR
jgi:DNA-binding NarL/FixJ family response regulator